jgi:DNA repair protein RadC
MLLMLFDRNYNMLAAYDIPGNSNSVQLSEKVIARKISLHPPVTQVIVAHNHPGGSFEPSPADINSTITLKNILGKMNITLLDHIIVCKDKCASLMKFSTVNKEQNL